MLETVTSFKCRGSVVSDEGSKRQILSRTVKTTAALTKLKPVWNDRCISLSSKIRLMRSLVTSIFLYACQSWPFTVELQRRIRAIESHTERYYASHTKTITMLTTSELVRWCFEPSQPHRITSGLCYQRGSPCKDPAGNQTTRGPPDHHKEMQTEVV